MQKFILAAVLAAFAAAAGPAAAETVTVGPLTIENPWARASAGMARAGAAFMTIRNAGATDDRLVAATSTVSGRTELHTHIREGDVMRMRQVPAIDLPAGGAAILQPGGLHVMMMGLNGPLKQGESLGLELTFEKAGSVSVTVPILTAGAAGPMGDMKHDMGHGHGK